MARYIQQYCRFSVLAVVLAALSFDAWAILVPPADRNDTIQVTLDRGAPQADVQVFSRALGGNDTSHPDKFGLNSWTCVSATKTDTGACATEPVWAASGTGSTIRLTFTEELTGATTVLNLIGYVNAFRTAECNGSSITPTFAPNRLPIHWTQWFSLDTCPYTVFFDGRAVSVSIPVEQLKKLPSGGIWKANLRLNLRQWILLTIGKAPTLAVFRAAITLNVTDKNNIQVYLPEFTSATPAVDLKLRTLSGGRRLSGTSNVDMCVYDGYNAQSTWFDISASDGLSIGQRDRGSYSVLLDNDKSGIDASRIDYNVNLTYAGKTFALPNGETVRIPTANGSAGRRQVSLPGIAIPVICAPVPLELRTPEFESNRKRPGRYSHKLTITFTPSSASL